MEYLSAEHFYKALLSLSTGTEADVIAGDAPTPPTDQESADRASALNALITRRLMHTYGQMLKDQSQFDKLAKKLAQDFELQKQAPAELNRPKQTADMYASVLAPFIFHEVAHLRKRESAGFLEILDKAMAAIFGPSVREKEDAADKEALAVLSQFAAKKDFDDQLLAFGIRAFMSYLTASAWTLSFDNFRGMEAGELFWQFEYVPCDSWDSWFEGLRLRWRELASHAHVDPNDKAVLATLTPAKDWPANNLQNPMLLRAGRNIGFPVVTSAEFETIVSRTQASIGDGSHAPHFLRAFRFSEVAATLFEAASKAESGGGGAAARTAETLRHEWLGYEMSLIEAGNEPRPQEDAPFSRPRQ